MQFFSCLPRQKTHSSFSECISRSSELTQARSSRRNIELISNIAFGVYFLFVAISHLNSAKDRFDGSRHFEDGLLANAKIIAIPESQRGGTPVFVQFTDNKRRIQKSKTIVYSPEYLRVGQSVEVSYQPADPDWVRAPALDWSDSEYADMRRMCIVWIMGALCIFPLAIWRRFRKPSNRPLLKLSDADSKFTVKQDYFRLIIIWALYGFMLFMVYAIVTLSITHLLGLPIWLQKVSILAWHALLAYKIGLPAVRVLLNDPITINHAGVSFYGRPPVPWSDMSQILFVSGRHQDLDEKLIISLKPSSSIAAYPVLSIPMKQLSPLVSLDLYSTRWDDHDIVTAMNHFGLEKQDPQAARRLLNSLSESGFITGCTDPKDAHTREENSSSSKEHNYMGGGFHFDS